MPEISVRYTPWEINTILGRYTMQQFGITKEQTCILRPEGGKFEGVTIVLKDAEVVKKDLKDVSLED